jgi:uncharacterized membrane protein YkoI
MLRAIVFASLTALCCIQELAGAEEKYPDSRSTLTKAYRRSEPASLLLAQSSSDAKDGVAGQNIKRTKTISENEAKQIAEKAVPGRVTDLAIEKKRGANRFVVEVAPAAGGKEVDVIIDMTSGKVLGIEN